MLLPIVMNVVRLSSKHLIFSWFVSGKYNNIRGNDNLPNVGVKPSETVSSESGRPAVLFIEKKGGSGWRSWQEIMTRLCARLWARRTIEPTMIYNSVVTYDGSPRFNFRSSRWYLQDFNLSAVVTWWEVHCLPRFVSCEVYLKSHNTLSFL